MQMGLFITNPDNIGGASYSGVVNYINKFGYASGYKSYDPISEMYYEIIRYFKKLGPSTDRYCTNLDTIDDGAPVFVILIRGQKQISLVGGILLFIPVKRVL